jgi:hypothetical protein
VGCGLPLHVELAGKLRARPSLHRFGQERIKAARANRRAET